MRHQLGQLLGNINNFHRFGLDALIFLLSPWLALSLYLEGSANVVSHHPELLLMTLVFTGIKLMLFAVFGFYRRDWRLTGTDELLKTAVLILAALFLNSYLLTILTQVMTVRLPHALPLLDGLLSLILVGSLRVLSRSLSNGQRIMQPEVQLKRVLVVGAGRAGTALVQDMLENPQLGYRPFALVDDDPAKLHWQIKGVKVVGNRHTIPGVVKALNIEQIMIALPMASGTQIRELFTICQATTVETIALPSIHELMHQPVHCAQVREIRLEDLLRREPMRTDYYPIYHLLQHKRVLITGAGGSLGQELCRQVLRCHPAMLVLHDDDEHALYAIEQELQQFSCEQSPPLTTRLVAFVGDLRSRSRLAHAFEQHRPEVVFHGAAYQQVPLMEQNVPEAITHNVLGTQNLVDMTIRYNTRHFVMISTDKAVNPTSVAGASQRIAEMLVLQAAQVSRQTYCVIRCSNLLGSRGSVVPLFQKQIAAGGPVTVTHPDACRYFMTLAEAAQLTLQAAAMSKGNEIYVANLGQPVKIVDLARDLIHLSGYQVGKEIEITFTGLRPGEKLYEELLVPGEEYAATRHPRLMVVHNSRQILSDTLPILVQALGRVAINNDIPLTLSFLRQILPTYTPVTVTPPQSPKPPAIPQASVNNIQPWDRSVLQAMPRLRGRRLTRRQMTVALQQAIRQQEFRLLYQPIFSLKNVRRLNGFEALLRWHNPAWGVVAPPTFIRVAEATGLIIPIGWWVLDEVCRELRSWQDQHHVQPATIGINLSGQQLLHPELVTRMAQSLNTYGLAGHCLRVEVSDDLIRSNVELILQVLSQIQALGVQVQIDRYGGGQNFYSGPLHTPSLAYDQFDCLKIDHLLIRQINQNPDCLARIHDILGQTQALGLDLIATGVETAAQLAQLKALHCHYGQGFYLAKPVRGEAAKVLYETSDRTSMHPTGLNVPLVND